MPNEAYHTRLTRFTIERLPVAGFGATDQRISCNIDLGHGYFAGFHSFLAGAGVDERALHDHTLLALDERIGYHLAAVGQGPDKDPAP
jgi:hypothetical protein